MRYVSAWTQYLAAAGIILLVAAGMLAMRSHLNPIDVAMLFLLAVVVVASRYPRGPAVLASLLSIALFDFLFVPPYSRFSVHDTAYLLTFGMMLVIAITMSRLTARIREQAEAARELAERHETARVAVASERLRTALLSSLSHDLRTPLGTIEGAASTLASGDAELAPEVRRELAETVLDQSRRMTRLVSNLLEMMRLETGALAVQHNWQPLEEPLGVALLRMEEVLREHPVEVQLPEDLPIVSVDEVLLEQVFVNLLENAAKHAPPGTPIRMSAWREGEAVVVEVADQGPGIPAGEEEAVFRKFYRGGTPGSGPLSEGSGLGLAICRGIVSAHGGRIWAETGRTRGAAFRFTIPLTAAPPVLPAESMDTGVAEWP
jgi:two-component system sensor histidine kinase KdpD